MNAHKQSPKSIRLDGAPETFNPLAFLDTQRRATEVWAAVGQRYLEGLRDVASQSFLVQSALYQQAIANLSNFSQVGSTANSADRNMRTATSAMETTVGAIRDTIATACKCNTDIMATLQESLTAGATGAGKSMPARTHGGIGMDSPDRGRS